MFTEADAIVALREVVAEFGPDHTYPDEDRDENDQPVYVLPDGRPGCVVGQVLAKWGLLDHRVAVRNLNVLSLADGGAGLPVCTIDAARVLGAAQDVQDSGIDEAGGEWDPDERSWGSALEAAEHLYAGLSARP